MKLKIWGVCDPKLRVTLAQKIINLGWLWPKILGLNGMILKIDIMLKKDIKTLSRLGFEI